MSQRELQSVLWLAGGREGTRNKFIFETHVELREERRISPHSAALGEAAEFRAKNKRFG